MYKAGAKQLEAMAREPIMIENTVHVDTECHHHHHQVVPQLSLSEQIRQIVGGVLQSGTTYLWSKAMEIIGMWAFVLYYMYILTHELYNPQD